MSLDNLDAVDVHPQRLMAATTNSPAPAGGRPASGTGSTALAVARPSTDAPDHEPTALGPPRRWPTHQRAIKRGMDILISLTILVITAPLWPVIALAIVAESRGPVLFRQRRFGRGGAEFQILKFRTMRVAAEAHLTADRDLHERFKANGYKLPAGEDPRVTRVGSFLRRTSLDELPQLLNVLRGDMSVVGPRPPLDDQIDELYGDFAPYYFAVRPGLTGPWQVQGRSDLGPSQRCRIDVDYVQTATLGTDLHVLIRTPRAVLSGEGAH